MVSVLGDLGSGFQDSLSQLLTEVSGDLKPKITVTIKNL